MNTNECEIVADCGASLRNLRDGFLELWLNTNDHEWWRAAMRVSELYGTLAVLPLEAEQ